MTNHWRDIRHADLILINGANPAEAHPVGFQWFMRAKLNRGAKIVHADPRFTRTSAVADMYLRMRVGTDVAYFGGLINHVLQNNLFHDAYVRNYTNASFITGIPVADFKKGADLVGQMGQPDKVMTIVYAVGLTHHTTGGQLIRSGAVLQLLLGNMGRPGGGMNAERGHANIQGNTDHAISWDILPGYLRIPAPDQKNLDQYVAINAPKRSDPNSWNFFGINYRNFMVSLLKGWYGAAATKDNEFAYHLLPKPTTNASWMSIFDQALRGKMEGVFLSGMTATSIGPDSNQIMQALSNL